MDKQEIVQKLIGTADSITLRLDGSLSAIKGITFSEYRLLSAIEGEREAQATRVLLAQRTGLTPSGVTRALKPLEKLGYVETVRDTRDARRSIASLTAAGQELVRDAAGVVNDTLNGMAGLEKLSETGEVEFVQALDALAAH